MGPKEPVRIQRLSTRLGEVAEKSRSSYICNRTVAYVHVKALYYFHDRFKGWHISPYVKPLVGGLAVGALGIAAPQTLGI